MKKRSNLRSLCSAKNYQKPSMKVVKLQPSGIICISVNSNVGLNYRGGGSGPARARGFDEVDWDEE